MTKKNIIVTGAMGNLGSACVEKFLKEGCSVSALISHGKKLREQKNLFSYQADLIHEIEAASAIEKIISDHKRIHGAVLTVGGFAMGTIEQTSMEDIQKMIALNFSTAYNIILPLLKHFKSYDGGGIVLVGARPALEATGGKTSVGYALSKTLIFKLADLINADTSKKKIKTSVIVPNIIDTPENRKNMPDADFGQWLPPQSIANITYDVILGNRNESIIKLYS